jgi:CRP-like cAMP-binding protein
MTSSASQPSDGRTNRLLAALPTDVYDRLRAAMTPVALRHAQQLYDIGEPITHVYFPLTALVSLLILLEDGKQVEMAAVGREGMAGVPVVLGADTDNHAAVAQVPGTALRLDTETLRAVLRVAPELQQLLGRYTLVLITQAGQAAACNGLHALAERGARWLLETHDRVGADQFPLTQDFLAAMLGVRRPSVTIAAGILQQAGLITYHRGQVTILDRAGLEAASCECYAIIRREIDRLLSDPAPAPPKLRTHTATTPRRP